MTPRGIGTWLVSSHALLAAAHGASHAHLGVALTSFQGAFVAIVILAGPFVALGLLWCARPKWALALLGGSLAAAFLFGFLYHFSLAGADNVGGMSHQSWGSGFRVTAIGLAFVEGMGCVWCLGELRR